MVRSGTCKMEGSPLGESLGSEYGSEGGSYGDISGVELEGSVLGES